MPTSKLRVYKDDNRETSYTAAPIYDWTGDVPVEDQARAQIGRVSRLPFVTQMAVMPDCHYGMGATIGTIIVTDGALIPSAVGVDIGCGILGYKTNLLRSEILGKEEAIRQYIQQAIPNGRTAQGADGDIGKWGTKHKRPALVNEALDELMPAYVELTDAIGFQPHPFVQDHLGTLGTGNHFIEIAEDERGYLWILVHSGSRGPGAKFANHWMKTARNLAQKWHIPLEDPDLGYFPVGTTEFHQYWEHVQWALKYAAASRRIMTELTLGILNRFSLGGVEATTKVDTSHNYVAPMSSAKGSYITRKGASKAKVGELSVMPGSMGTRSYIVEGKSNPKSLFSCSHGAGRSMSRTQALKTFTLDDHLKATDGVYCRKDIEVLDETPGAYKDIDLVLAQQDELVTVVHTLKAIINVKG